MSDLMNTTLPLAGVTGLLEEITASQFNGEIKLDRETGQPTWKIGLSAKFEGLPRRVPLDVLIVAAEPPSIEIGTEVSLTSPTVAFWLLKNGKAGVTVRARDVVPASDPQPQVATAESAERRLPTKPQQGGEGK